MSRPGGGLFADELSDFAAGVSDLRLTAIAERMAAPLRVAVGGRRGVGRRTVGRALACAEIVVTPQQDAQDADVVVYVVAEVVKPEDVAAVAALTQPTLAVLNKTDLGGRAAAVDVAARLGVLTEPMAGLLAVAALEGLDDSLWAALRMLADEPADLSCAERFLTGPHPVPRVVRLRLYEALDLSGITHAVAAMRQGWPTNRIRALLRRLSGVDEVVRRIGAIGATARYQRLLEAVSGLQVLAVGDGRIGDFLACDNTVLARMAAAVEVIEAAGLTLDGPAGTDGPAVQLRRAVRWQHYSRGPVAAVHRACGTDIARGSLRLWSTAEGSRSERV